jgi:tetratricopeptide (TPR) repeat protein
MSETKTRLSRWISASRTALPGVAAIALALGAVVAVLAQGPQDPSVLLDAAVADFERGRIDESVAKFNQLVAVAPRAMPQLWQRGIALYYAGRYDDCRKQFEAHRTVNPDDVENAAWHFLCVARAESPARARAALLPVGPDARVPMREVLELFRGKMTTDQVVAAAGTSVSGQFYGHLYVGLYHEATGDNARARPALETAANERFRSAGGYMHMVARVHVARLGKR